MVTPALLPLVAVFSSFALAIAAGFARTARPSLRWGFGLGMVGLGLESATAFVLMTQTSTAAEREAWLAALQALGLLLLLPWALFTVRLVSGIPRLRTRGARYAIGAAAAMILTTAAAVASLPAFDVAVVDGPFHAAVLDSVGRLAIVVQLVATVAIVAGLEAVLLTSRHDMRWRIKYLLLGLGGIFLVRFYILSQLLLFGVVMASYLITLAASQIVANTLIAVSFLRSGLGVEVTVSRHVVYRSVVVGVLGLYLLSVGALGWLLNRLGLPEDLLWGSMVVFVSALGLAAVMLSDNLRWRLKRFIGLHFYGTKYDYREQWVRFTKRLGSRLQLDELAPLLTEAVMDAVGTARGALYLVQQETAAHHLAATRGLDVRPRASLDPATPLIARLASDLRPLLFDEAPDLLTAIGDTTVTGQFTGGLAVPLRWHGSLAGVILLGPERAGAAYAPEDLELLETVGEQAGVVVATARLSEAEARTREFAAFTRLTSFVIHDLKNSISALSMLSENALANFDDPEFQRDALKTVARSVDRMNALLARLSPTAGTDKLQSRPVDLAAIAAEAVKPLTGSRKITVVKDVSPVPRVAGDADALLRVLQNLVSNAVEAVGGDGTITIRTFDETGHAVVSVTDSGRGMSDDFIRTSLFAPFRSTKKGGWGIGLFQAKTVVEAHGGLIEVVSKEGAGTTFSVRLPIPGAAGE